MDQISKVGSGPEDETPDIKEPVAVPAVDPVVEPTPIEEPSAPLPELEAKRKRGRPRNTGERKPSIFFTKPPKTKKATMDITRQTDKVKAIVALLIENPKLDRATISKETKIPYPEVNQYMNSNRYIFALKAIASGKITGYLPLAVRGFKDCLESPNMEIKYKACVKLLENENILGAARIDLNLTDLRSQPIDQIERIIEMGQTLAKQTILNADVLQ